MSSISRWRLSGLLLASVCMLQVSTAPQADRQQTTPSTALPDPDDGPSAGPRPYQYQYEVEDAEKELYYEVNETGDEQGKVIGGYKVLLPDGRLMQVEYTVDGDSGFVPKISFQPNFKPTYKNNDNPDSSQSNSKSTNNNNAKLRNK